MADAPSSIPDAPLIDASAIETSSPPSVTAYSTSAPTTLSTNTSPPLVLAENSANLYWKSADGAVMAIPKNGGSATTLAHENGTPVDLRATDTDLYFQSGAGLPDAGKPYPNSDTLCLVATVSLVDASVGCFFPESSSCSAHRITTDPTYGLWLEYRDANLQGSQIVTRLSYSGVLDPLGSGLDPYGPMVADGVQVYFAYDRAFPAWCDGGYCVDQTASALKPGVPAYQTFAVADGPAFDIVQYGTGIYWLTATGVYSAHTQSDEMAPILCAVSQGARLAIDANYVYVTTPTEVVRCATAIDAGVSSVEVVAANEQAPNGIVVDDANIYWANEGDGTIRAIGKSP